MTKKKIGFANWSKEDHAYNAQYLKALRLFKKQGGNLDTPKGIDEFNKFRKKHGFK